MSIDLNYNFIKYMYENLQQQDSTYKKIRRSLYLIVSISLLTHTLSVTYSIMSLKEESAGFISIIVSAIVCFFFSSSHLTIYGISILGIMYLKILEQNGYSRTQLSYVVAMSGIVIFPFWKAVHAIDSIFHSLPGRIHASMVFGIALIVLTKFFPLSIQNITAFFIASNADALTSPIQIIKLTFSTFNLITLILTIASILVIYLLRNKLSNIPFIAFLVILGILINIKHHFKSYEDLCLYEGVDCKFYIIKIQNLIQPTLAQIFGLIPASLVMTAIIIFEQFLYLEQFERRGKRFGGQGNLGDVRTESRVLALSNAISGSLGGFPICINLFATYENFAFNQKYGFRGTKWVGLMQIPVSYLLYSILKRVFDMIPLFILFTIVATPTIYFLRNMLRIYYRHVIFITVLASINVLTHPIIGLIIACFISIADIAELLKAAPSEIILQNINTEGERKSSTFVKVVQKQNNINNKFISEFVSRVIEIENDKPTSLDGASYVLYRLTGSISYLNYFEHINQINFMLEKYIKPNDGILIISFRYSQIIDEQSLEQMAIFVEKLRDTHIRVLFTGLYPKLMLEMEKIPYFMKMLQEDDRSMYSVPQFE